MWKTGNNDMDDAAGEPGRGAAMRLLRSRDGAAAIEFALLAIPYFLIVFAIIETFVAFTGEQLVANAVDTLARKVRTGQITATNTTEAGFRGMFCDEVSILIQCGTEDDGKLIIDLRSFATFADIPDYIPRDGGALQASGNFSPGGPGSKNMLRAYYKWSVVTDLVRPYISGLRPVDGSIPDEFLIVATASFQNEDY